MNFIVYFVGMRMYRDYKKVIVFLLANRKLRDNDKNHLIFTAFWRRWCWWYASELPLFQIDSKIFSTFAIFFSILCVRYNLRLRICLDGISKFHGDFIRCHMLASARKCKTLSHAECKTRRQSMRIILVLSWISHSSASPSLVLFRRLYCSIARSICRLGLFSEKWDSLCGTKHISYLTFTGVVKPFLIRCVCIYHCVG